LTRNKIWLKRLFPGGYDRYCDLARAKRAGRIVLLLAAMILFGLAAARPAWGERILPDSIGGRDLIVVMDVSKSMLSDNVRPTRLDHAKQLVREVVSRNSGDRFGLIAFAGNAELICPLTADSGSFLSALDA